MRMSRRRASTTGAKPDLRTARRLELGTLTEVASRNGIITAARRSAAKALIRGELKGVYLLTIPTIKNAKAIVRSTTRQR